MSAGAPDQPDWPEQIGAGRWVDFGGLPADLTEGQLLDAFERSRPAGAGQSVLLSRRPHTLVELDGMRYWLGPAGEVVLVEIEDPSSATAVGDLLAALGPPAREGSGRYRRAGASTTEYVYPERGLALTVAESYDDPPAFEPMVAAVQLFAPTDLQGFVTRLGGAQRGGPQY